MGRVNEIIRINEQLVYGGSYHLTPRAFKTICYIIAKYVDPRAESLPPMVLISVRELSNAIMDGKDGGQYKALYRELDSLCKELSESVIAFKSDVWNGNKEMKGYTSWCSAAIPKTENGVKCIAFHFGPHMADFLLGLSKYVRLYRSELNRLTSGYAIRLFQILKGDRNKKEKFGARSIRVFEIEELRFLLGLGEKYAGFKELNRRVLKVAIQQINEATTIRIISTKSLRRRGGRTISHVEFQFVNQVPGESLGYLPALKKLPDFVPSDADFEKLSRAELLAYDLLEKFGVKPGIAFRKIIPEIAGSESYGFEDYFITSALEHFREHAKNKKSKEQSAATFVNWWVRHKVFDTTSDVWAKITEHIVKVKKGLQKDNPEGFENRLIARTMTRQEFVDWWRQSA